MRKGPLTLWLLIDAPISDCCVNRHLIAVPPWQGFWYSSDEEYTAPCSAKHLKGSGVWRPVSMTSEASWQGQVNNAMWLPIATQEERGWQVVLKLRSSPRLVLKPVVVFVAENPNDESCEGKFYRFQLFLFCTEMFRRTTIMVCILYQLDII